MTTGELIFVGVVGLWLITFFYGIVFVDKDKINWPCIIGCLFTPLLAVVAYFCGLR